MFGTIIGYCASNITKVSVLIIDPRYDFGVKGHGQICSKLA